MKIHVPRRKSTFLCYFILIYFRWNFENFTDFSNRCQSQILKMPNEQCIFFKYLRFILPIGTYEAPVPGWRREKFFSELRHFSLSYFHIFSCFTYKKLFYGNISVTIVFCASEYPTWRVLMSIGHTVRSKSRLREIISLSADHKIDNFSVRQLRNELRYGFNISFPTVIIGNE